MDTVSDFLIERLYAWGVRRIYGYPGDGINGLIAALHRAEDRIAFVQVRHEEQAAFMATAHAKFSGQAATSALGSEYQLEVDLHARDVSATRAAIAGHPVNPQDVFVALSPCR
jgi:pyruvate dehydrogenase (quinone)